MGYKKCIQNTRNKYYYAQNLELLGVDYLGIVDAYVDAGKVIAVFETLEDLQNWNEGVRRYKRMLIPRFSKKGCVDYGTDVQLNAHSLDISMQKDILYDTNDYVECNDCEDIVPRDETIVVGDNYICEYCSGSYYFCERCGEYHSEDDFVDVRISAYNNSTEYMCNSCARTHATMCDNCGEWFLYDAYYAPDGEPYCLDCFDNHCRVCDSCCEVMWRDDVNWTDDGGGYCDECYSEHSRDIRRYHNNPPKRIHYGSGETPSGMLIGTEIETEHKDGDENMNERIEITRKYGEDENYIYQMRDGSLDDSGIECITQPMSKVFWDNFRFEDWFQDLIDAGTISHNSSRCGLHVHLSRKWMQTDDYDTQAIYVARMRQFISDNKEWVQKFSRRRECNWCAYTKTFEKEDKPTDKTEREGKHKEAGKKMDRYQSVNNNCRETIEFRIFRGTLKANTYRASVEFCLRLVDYIITHEEGTETMEEFLKYKPLPQSMITYMGERHLSI